PKRSFRCHREFHNQAVGTVSVSHPTTELKQITFPEFPKNAVAFRAGEDAGISLALIEVLSFQIGLVIATCNGSTAAVFGSTACGFGCFGRRTNAPAVW